MWRIELSKRAEKAFLKLERIDQKRILTVLGRISTADEPRQLGTPLKGYNFKGLWRFRAGNFRIISRLEDDSLLVLVVHIGHRKDVYE